MNKEFGRLSREQVREIFSALFSIETDMKELSDTLRHDVESQNLIIPWAGLYELPFEQHIAAFILAMDMEHLLKKAAASQDPQQFIIDHFAPGLADEIDVDEFSIDDKQVFTALLISISHQISALRTFSQSMSTLVKKAKGGDKVALFRAIWVDRSCTATPSIARIIAVAQASEDSPFMAQLAKAITRTKPAMPKPEYSDLRYMLEVLLESDEAKTLTTTDLEDILAFDLELYPNESDYSLRAFRKFIQKRNTMVGT